MVTRAVAFSAMVLAVLLSGCRQDMQDQPRYKPLQRSDFFPDGRSARPILPGTIARGHRNSDPAFFQGEVDGQFVPVAPVKIDKALLQRGHDRYDIFCSPCHSRAGDGRGMVALRGFRYPPSFHSERLRSVPDGYIFQVITSGYGAMSSYSYQLEPRDRWAVTEYIRVLQFSRNAHADDLSDSDRRALTKAQSAEAQR